MGPADNRKEPRLNTRSRQWGGLFSELARDPGTTHVFASLPRRFLLELDPRAIVAWDRALTKEETSETSVNRSRLFTLANYHCCTDHLFDNVARSTALTLYLCKVGRQSREGLLLLKYRSIFGADAVFPRLSLGRRDRTERNRVRPACTRNHRRPSPSFLHASTRTNPSAVRPRRAPGPGSLKDARKGRMDDLAHVPLPDYVNLTDTNLRGKVETNKLSSRRGGQRC